MQRGEKGASGHEGHKQAQRERVGTSRHDGRKPDIQIGNSSIYLVSTYVVCERLSVMHKQVCVQ